MILTLIGVSLVAENCLITIFDFQCDALVILRPSRHQQQISQVRIAFYFDFALISIAGATVGKNWAIGVRLPVLVDVALIVVAQYAILFTIDRALFYTTTTDSNSGPVFQRASTHVLACCTAWLALQFARNHLQHASVITEIQQWLLTVAAVLIPFAADDIRSFLPVEYHERGAVVLPTLLLFFTIMAWSLTVCGRIAACVCYQTLHVLLDAGAIHVENDPFAFWCTNSMFAVVAIALDVVSGVFCRKQAQLSALKAKLQALFDDHAYWLGLVSFGNVWLMQMFCMPEILILKDNVNQSDVVPDPLGFWQRDWPCRGSIYILSLYACSHALFWVLGIAKRRKLWIVLSSLGLLAIVHLLCLTAWHAYPLSPLTTMSEHIQQLTNTAHK